jgi:hypothetical protein
MHKLIAAGAAVSGLTAAFVPASTAVAEAELPAPEVAFVGDNVVVSANGAEATVLAKYRCYGGEEGTHLWVSVKQDGEDLEGEGSSARARAWYDTNYQYAEDPAGQTIACDGRWHATRFTVKLVDGWGELARRTAYVQFCAFDNRGNLASVNGWKSVRVGS